jgi:hypothetical protein
MSETENSFVISDSESNESIKSKTVKASKAIKKEKPNSTTTKQFKNVKQEENLNNAKSKGFNNDITKNAVLKTPRMNADEDITRGPATTTDAEAKKLICLYLRKQNRPYSAIQMHDNLHKRISKATLERVLTALSSTPSSSVLCKEYGKAKIYYIDQTSLTSNYSAEQFEALQSENEVTKKQLEIAQQLENSLQQQLNTLKNEPNDAELQR